LYNVYEWKGRETEGLKGICSGNVNGVGRKDGGGMETG